MGWSSRRGRRSDGPRTRLASPAPPASSSVAHERSQCPASTSGPLLLTFGYIGLFSIIFAESGLLFGFFLPGDSLLITAGVLSFARPDVFSLAIVCIGCFIAAVAGDAVGYWTGSRYGRRLYDRPDSRFFKKGHLAAAEAFYTKHGGRTIMIARWMPFVRAFAPVVAGTAAMPYRRFAAYNFTGRRPLWGRESAGPGVCAGG